MMLLILLLLAQTTISPNQSLGLYWSENVNSTHQHVDRGQLRDVPSVSASLANNVLSVAGCTVAPATASAVVYVLWRQNQLVVFAGENINGAYVPTSQVVTVAGCPTVEAAGPGMLPDKVQAIVWFGSVLDGRFAGGCVVDAPLSYSPGQLAASGNCTTP